MLDRLREAIPKDFLDNELAELREHRLRFGLLICSMAVLIIFLVLDDVPIDPPTELVEEESLVEEEPTPVERIDRRTEIIGLARASEDVQLINPFAVDLPKPPPEPLIIPITTPAPPPPPPLSTLDKRGVPKPEPTSKVMLTLKGTAIGDNKKIAVVNREVIGGKVDEESGAQAGRRIEHRLLKIGDAVDGRKVVDIGKNFVEFDDGERLELPKVQTDD